MKCVAWMATVGLVAAARAQVPDVSIKLEMFPTYLSLSSGHTTTRLYDSLGRLSTVALQFQTELGVRIYVAEKLQIIPGGGDDDNLDQYYAETAENWRVGKQYLPFGQNGLVREDAVAVRSYLTMPLLNVPFQVAGCDNGSGKQRGVIGRIGDNYGLSFAIGEHFGIDGTSFAYLRPPTQAAGAGHGFHAILGLDYGSGTGPWYLVGELVALRGPESATDAEDELSDVALRFKPSRWHDYEVGWSHAVEAHVDVFRVRGSIRVNKQVTVDPMVRFRDGTFYDLTVSLHVKF